MGTATPREFHYRLPGRTGGYRPGSHPGARLGAGQEFISHARLYDQPDPRRLDLRASLREPNGEWLVRAYRQRTSVAVHAVVDVSASMAFGAGRPKLHVAADFVEALGYSAFRAGDAVGMVAFDARARMDLFVPPMVNRGIGRVMASKLRQGMCSTAGVGGLESATAHLAGRQGLVFLLSDFHWPMDRLRAAVDIFAHAHVVPIILWDPAEIEPPSRNAIAPLRDAESGAQRTLWLRPKVRAQWRAEVARRRAELARFFAGRGIRPFFMQGSFDADALSRYFFGAVT